MIIMMEKVILQKLLAAAPIKYLLLLKCLYHLRSSFRVTILFYFFWKPESKSKGLGFSLYFTKVDTFGTGFIFQNHPT